MDRRLYKSRTNVMLDGVCAGVARYLGLDVTIVRLVWVLANFMGFSGVLVYIVCAVIIPREPDHSDYVDYTENNHN